MPLAFKAQTAAIASSIVSPATNRRAMRLARPLRRTNVKTRC
jgi:hypothetical protein